MKFYLTKEQFNDLIKISRSSKLEQAGKMTFVKDKDDYYLSGIEVYTKDKGYIEKNTRKSIEINNKESLIEVMNDILNFASDENIIVRFHTHPSDKSLAYYSKNDEKYIKKLQGTMDAFNKIKNIKNIYVEGIITNKEIAFYYYDGISIKRIPTYIDLVEHIPKVPDERKLLNAFMDGFMSGKKSR